MKPSMDSKQASRDSAASSARADDARNQAMTEPQVIGLEAENRQLQQTISQMREQLGQAHPQGSALALSGQRL